MKPIKDGTRKVMTPSLPSRERELKRARECRLRVGVVSLPSRERELKRREDFAVVRKVASLPSRERELKRPPRRSRQLRSHVAPLAGARIETKFTSLKSVVFLSRSPRGSAN